MEVMNINNMCRCCASEGTYKDVKSVYHWMGEREVYSDMLRDCFDITLSEPEDCGAGGICEVCITQLRNAFNFKKQVKLTEEQFQRQIQDKLFKRDIVKVEVPGTADESNDEEEEDDRLAEDYSVEYDDMEIKEEEEAKPRKRSAKATATTRAKKPKTEEAETSKRNTGVDTPKPVKVTKIALKRARKALKIERDEEKKNLMEILFHSNANLIKYKDITGIKCAYCDVTMPKSKDLKEHFTLLHKDETFIQTKLQMFSKQVIRLDITDLKCEICSAEIPSLKDLLYHFKLTHNLNVNTEVPNSQMLQFRFDDDKMKCVYCGAAYPVFKLLREHMNMHFRKFVCDSCDAAFISSELLYRHKLRHVVSDCVCKFCPKTFTNKDRLRRHEETVHLGIKKNKCNYCDERFDEFNQKLKHMKNVHDRDLNVSCSICNKQFVTPKQVREHTRKEHLMEKYFQCDECGKQFFAKSQMKSHMVTHRIDALYQCGECFKTFARSTSLNAHFKIHEAELLYEFQCDFCSKRFQEKIGLKRHLVIEHSDLFK